MEMRESLGGGYPGDIVANREAWKLQFVIRMSDRRYNTIYVTVFPNEIPNLCTSLLDMMNKYIYLKSVVENGVQITDKSGHIDLQIGGSFDGVSIAMYRFMDIESVNGYVAVLNGVPSRGENLVRGIRLAESLPTPLSVVSRSQTAEAQAATSASASTRGDFWWPGKG